MRASPAVAPTTLLCAALLAGGASQPAVDVLRAAEGTEVLAPANPPSSPPSPSLPPVSPPPSLPLSAPPSHPPPLPPPSDPPSSPPSAPPSSPPPSPPPPTPPPSPPPCDLSGHKNVATIDGDDVSSALAGFGCGSSLVHTIHSVPQAPGERVSVFYPLPSRGDDAAAPAETVTVRVCTLGTASSDVSLVLYEGCPTEQGALATTRSGSSCWEARLQVESALTALNALVMGLHGASYTLEMSCRRESPPGANGIAAVRGRGAPYLWLLVFLRNLASFLVRTHVFILLGLLLVGLLGYYAAQRVLPYALAVVEQSRRGSADSGEPRRERRGGKHQHHHRRKHRSRSSSKDISRRNSPPTMVTYNMQLV
mmetsp:Transcript_15902/g.42797  ORF Transcript_15902/g.42797 Transcript_15902/m.42797 type:complete len:367 (+) Transcript_15902:41-1141(+)